MSYNPEKQSTATYSAYLNTSSSSLSTQSQNGYYEFLFDTVNGACNIDSNGRIECESNNSITTCDISTSAGNLCIFNYGFTNGTYRTASHIRNQYSKGDDCAVGVHINNVTIKVDTGAFFYGTGSRNIHGLDQLVGVII